MTVAAQDHVPADDSLIARSLAGRLRGFGRDEDGQILPLVFFLGIAFFTSVMLIVNTGRTTVRRVKAQNAIDAAVVSGTTSLARGMNYVASNNIQISKSLALVVILRAFPASFDAAETTLKVWKAVAKAMHAAANTPWTAWLHAVATGIEIKVQIEETVIDVVEPIVETLAEDILGVDDEDNGLIWLAIKGMHYIGHGIVWATPVLAQMTANRIYNKNIGPDSGQGFMLPIYPNLPVCEGGFGDFYDKTRDYTESAAKPIYIASAIVLTLSLFPLWYWINLEIQLKKLFTGEEGNPPEGGSDAADGLADMQDQINDINDQMKDVRKRRGEILDDLVDLGETAGLNLDSEAARLSQIKGEIATQEQKAADAETEAQAQAAADQLESLENERQQIYDSLVNEIKGKINALKNTGVDDKIDLANDTADTLGRASPKKGLMGQWETQKEKLNSLENQLEDLDVGGQVDDAMEGEDIDSEPGGFGEQPANTQDRDWPHPWLIDPTEYPISFSYLALGYRDLPEPVVSKHFERAVASGFVYSAGRLYNPTSADLWTPDWRARLVRVDRELLTKNPLGKLPAECGDDAGTGEGELPADEETPEPGAMQGILDDIINALNKH